MIVMLVTTWTIVWSKITVQTSGNQYTHRKQLLNVLKVEQKCSNWIQAPLHSPRTNLWIQLPNVLKVEQRTQIDYRFRCIHKEPICVYNTICKAVTAGIITIFKENMETKLPDLFTKVLPRKRSNNLLSCIVQKLQFYLEKNDGKRDQIGRPALKNQKHHRLPTWQELGSSSPIFIRGAFKYLCIEAFGMIYLVSPV